jgi:hypothetical protein
MPVLVLDLGTGAEHIVGNREAQKALDRHRHRDEPVVVAGYYFTREARGMLEAAGCYIAAVSDFYSASEETLNDR